MNIDKDDLTNSIEQIITEAVIEGEDVEVTTGRIVKFVWPIIEYLNRHDPAVMPTEECVKQWYAEGNEEGNEEGHQDYWNCWRCRTNNEVVYEIMTALKYFMTTWQGSGDMDKLAREIAEMPDEEYEANCKAVEKMAQHKPEPDFTDEDILDEMEADMNQWGVAQGEIESMRQDWRNRFLIVRRER